MNSDSFMKNIREPIIKKRKFPHPDKDENLSSFSGQRHPKKLRSEVSERIPTKFIAPLQQPHSFPNSSQSHSSPVASRTSSYPKSSSSNNTQPLSTPTSSSARSDLYPKHACEVSTSEDFIKVGLSPQIKNMIPHALPVKTNISSSQATAVLLMLKQFFKHRRENESPIDNRGGFILADGTGLGKTRILSSFIYNLIFCSDNDTDERSSSPSPLPPLKKTTPLKKQPHRSFLWVTSKTELFDDLYKELHSTNEDIYKKINIYKLNEYIARETSLISAAEVNEGIDDDADIDVETKAHIDIGHDDDGDVNSDSDAPIATIVLATYKLLQLNLLHFLRPFFEDGEGCEEKKRKGENCWENEPNRNNPRRRRRSRYLHQFKTFDAILYDEFHAIRNTSSYYNKTIIANTSANADYAQIAKNLFRNGERFWKGFNIADSGDFLVKVCKKHSYFALTSATPFTEDANLSSVEFLVANAFLNAGRGEKTKINFYRLSRYIRSSAAKGSISVLGPILKILYHHGLYISRVISMRGVNCYMSKLKLDPGIRMCFSESNRYIDYLTRFRQSFRRENWKRYCDDAKGEIESDDSKGEVNIIATPATFWSSSSPSDSRSRRRSVSLFEAVSDYEALEKNNFVDSYGDTILFADVEIKEALNAFGIDEKAIKQKRDELESERSILNFKKNLLWRKFKAAIVLFYKNLILNSKAKGCIGYMNKLFPMSVENNENIKVIFATAITGDNALVNNSKRITKILNEKKRMRKCKKAKRPKRSQFVDECYYNAKEEEEEDEHEQRQKQKQEPKEKKEKRQEEDEEGEGYEEYEQEEEEEETEEESKLGWDGELSGKELFTFCTNCQNYYLAEEDGKNKSNINNKDNCREKHCPHFPNATCHQLIDMYRSMLTISIIISLMEEISTYCLPTSSPPSYISVHPDEASASATSAAATATATATAPAAAPAVVAHGSISTSTANGSSSERTTKTPLPTQTPKKKFIRLFLPTTPPEFLLRCMPASFIDYVINGLGRKSCKEVTNRALMQIRDPKNSGCYFIAPNSENKKFNKSISAFNNDPRIKSIVVSNRGSTGINLHDSNENRSSGRRLHLFCDFPYSSSKVFQHMGRSHRTNQNTLPVYSIFTLDSFTTEERFSTILKKRLGDQRAGVFSNRYCNVVTDIFETEDYDSERGRKKTSNSSEETVNKLGVYRIILCSILLLSGGLRIPRNDCNTTTTFSSSAASSTHPFSSSGNRQLILHFSAKRKYLKRYLTDRTDELYKENQKIFSTKAYFYMTLCFSEFLIKKRKDILAYMLLEPFVDDLNRNVYIRWSRKIIEEIDNACTSNARSFGQAKILNMIMYSPPRFQRLFFLVQKSTCLWFLKIKRVMEKFLTRKHNITCGVVTKALFKSKDHFKIRLKIFNAELIDMFGAEEVTLSNKNALLFNDYALAFHVLLQFKDKCISPEIKSDLLIFRLFEKTFVNYQYRYALYRYKCENN